MFSAKKTGTKFKLFSNKKNIKKKLKSKILSAKVFPTLLKKTHLLFKTDFMKTVSSEY